MGKAGELLRRGQLEARDADLEAPGRGEETLVIARERNRLPLPAQKRDRREMERHPRIAESKIRRLQPKNTAPAYRRRCKLAHYPRDGRHT